MSCFETFITRFRRQEPISITEQDVQQYLIKLRQTGVFTSKLNKVINIVKFYYETVLQMPNRFYSIDRPFKEDRIPKVIGKAEVQKYSK
ncbi:MAG: phage integrase N-terminal SAM-like domain-containing protein [Crocinitomix sp.]|nr:phage integrase N-terminal SAM-like domain-containing protein [Crocinitomix sp.]